MDIPPDSDSDIQSELSQLSLTQLSQGDILTPRIAPRAIDFNIDGDNYKVSGVHVDYDIDSVVVAARSLRPFRIGERISVNLTSTDVALPTTQIKTIECVKAGFIGESCGKRCYYALRFAGYDMETIEVAFQLKIECVPDLTGKSDVLARLIKQRMLNEVILPAVRALSKIRPTSYRGGGFASWYPENIASGELAKVYVYGKDWPLFAENVNHFLQAESRRRDVPYTNVIFMRARHGTKADPSTSRIANEYYINSEHEDIVLLQFHVANVFWPPPNDGLLVQLDNLGKKLGSDSRGLWRYKVSFLNKFGYFRKNSFSKAKLLTAETEEASTLRMIERPESFITALVAYNPAIHTTIRSLGSTGIPYVVCGRFRLPSSSVPFCPPVVYRRNVDSTDSDPDYRPAEEEEEEEKEEEEEEDDDEDDVKNAISLLSAVAISLYLWTLQKQLGILQDDLRPSILCGLKTVTKLSRV